MAEAMDWAEVKRRLLDGTSVQILADLNGVTYKTMYNRIMAHQIKDGVTYLTPENTKGLKKAKAISKTKQAQAREKEKAAGIPNPMPGEMCMVDITKYNCATCANVIATPEYLSCIDGHIEIEKHCTKGHTYGGVYTCCSDYVTSALEPFIKTPEKKPSAPEDPGKLPEVTALMPETMDEIDRNIEACLQLAARYKQQAEDWQQIRQAFALSFKGRKLPEVDT